MTLFKTIHREIEHKEKFICEVCGKWLRYVVLHGKAVKICTKCKTVK